MRLLWNVFNDCCNLVNSGVIDHETFPNCVGATEIFDCAGFCDHYGVRVYQCSFWIPCNYRNIKKIEKGRIRVTNSSFLDIFIAFLYQEASVLA